MQISRFLEKLLKIFDSRYVSFWKVLEIVDQCKK